MKLSLTHKLMSRQIFAIALAIFSALLAGACSDDPHSKGFGSETTNGIVASGTLTLDNTPVSGALVRIKPARATSTSADTTLTCTTNTQGQWSLGIPSAGGWTIEYRNQNMGAVHHFRTVDSDRAITLPRPQLAELTTLQGSIQTSAVLARKSAVNATQVELYGLGLQAIVQNDGSFSLDSIPHGYYTIQVIQDGVVQTESSVSTQSPIVIDPTQSSQLIIEDFNDGNGTPTIASVLLGGTWLAWWDSTLGSRVTPAISDGSGMSPAIQDTNAVEGKALHLQVDIDQLSPHELNLLCVLGSRGLQGQWEDMHNFSKADSAVFWAKGTGTLSFRLWTKANSDLSGGTRKMEHRLNLEPNWTRYAIAFRDMLWLDDSTVVANQWDSVSTYKFDFTKEDSGLLSVDQLLVTGISFVDILSP